MGASPESHAICKCCEKSVGVWNGEFGLHSGGTGNCGCGVICFNSYKIPTSPPFREKEPRYWRDAAATRKGAM